MADTIFFTEVEKTVQSALNLRKQHYAKASGKSTDVYSWIYKKRAWAQASVVSKVTGKSVTLGPRSGGGVGTNGLYRKSDTTPKYLPKPHLNSVKISPIGDWGSVVKCDFTFTVYSLAQLNEMQPFFDLGSKCEIQYGWQFAGPASGKNGKLNAVVYNFSQTLTDNGGFDCTIQTMAEGMAAVVGADIKGRDSKTNDTIESEDTTAKKSSNLYNQLSTIKKLIEPGMSINTLNTIAGIGITKIPANLLKSQFESDEVYKDESQLYISLEALTRQINIALYGKDDLRWKYFCNESITRGYPPSAPENVIQTESTVTVIPENASDTERAIILSGTTLGTSSIRNDFMSANPAQVIFPGFVQYNSVTIGFDTGEYAEKFKAGDLSKTMISIDYLLTLLQTESITKASQDRSKNTTISKFLQDVLTSIYDNSGTRFKLSIFQDTKDKSKVLITDQSYIGEDTTSITPYVLTSIKQGGICRQMSLSTNLSPEMVSAAYATSLNSLGSQPIYTAGESKSTAAESDIPISELLQNVLSASFLIASNSTKTEEQSSAVSNLQTALKELYTHQIKTQDSKGLIYPLSLQMTLDGIDGIIFGNAITTNYLPLAYKLSEIAFTVTTVEHTIQDGDWTTNINTVMRILK